MKILITVLAALLLWLPLCFADAHFAMSLPGLLVPAGFALLLPLLKGVLKREYVLSPTCRWVDCCLAVVLILGAIVSIGTGSPLVPEESQTQIQNPQAGALSAEGRGDQGYSVPMPAGSARSVDSPWVHRLALIPSLLAAASALGDLKEKLKTILSLVMFFGFIHGTIRILGGASQMRRGETEEGKTAIVSGALIAAAPLVMRILFEVFYSSDSSVFTG